MYAIVSAIFNTCEPHEIGSLDLSTCYGKVKTIASMAAEGDDMVASFSLKYDAVVKHMRPGMTEMEATRSVLSSMQLMQTTICSMMGMACTPEFLYGEEAVMMTEFCGVTVDTETGGAE